MRSTINIRDELLGEADRVAKRLGISRSRLFQDALEEYLKALRGKALTEQMNAHLEAHGQPIDAGFQRYIARAWKQDMGDDEW
jgi:metal-responsive CopG/Arc/MetJ family transcriptional regulator